jgi:hypothetical protein
MSKIFIVKCSFGEYEDYKEINLLACSTKELAEKQKEEFETQQNIRLDLCYKFHKAQDAYKSTSSWISKEGHETKYHERKTIPPAEWFEKLYEFQQNWTKQNLTRRQLKEFTEVIQTGGKNWIVIDGQTYEYSIEEIKFISDTK